MQETTYDYKADIWSLGITVLEMAEGHPPHHNVHPMRAIFMISLKPAPKLKKPSLFSADMIDFLEKCLVKSAEDRAGSSDLLCHPWIQNEVATARCNTGIPCLQELVAKHWDEIVASRLFKRQSIESSEANVEQSNLKLRNKIQLVRLSQTLSTAGKSDGEMSGTRTNFLGGDTFCVQILSGAEDTIQLNQPALSGPDRDEEGEEDEESNFEDTLVLSTAPSTVPFVDAMTGSTDVSEYDEDTIPHMKSNAASLRNDRSVASSAEETLEAESLSSVCYDASGDYKDREIHRNVDPGTIFLRSQVIGKGSYGVVYKGQHIRKGEQVAIKVLPFAHADEIGTEIEVLRNLENPFIVAFFQAIIFRRELWIVMEFCERGSLSDIMKKTTKVLMEPQIVGVVTSCLFGLSYLHLNRGIHRDIKAGNILLSKSGDVKLADFGVSAQLTQTLQQRNTLIGTPFWMAPEVIEETSYDSKADIWSLGVTVLELCEGHPPHFEVHPMRAIFLISNEPAPTVREPGLWTPNMHAFLDKCLQKVPQERSSADLLLATEWVLGTAELLRNGHKIDALTELANL